MSTAEPTTSSAADAEPTSSASAANGTGVLDRFGVRKLYPTATTGREWQLPDDAHKPSTEWNVEENPVTPVGDGVFHTIGNNGEVRLSVASPRGRAWWRNLEITGYYRYTEPNDSNDQERHWELVARGERHAHGSVASAAVNAGIAAPSGTSAWPSYPFNQGSLSAPCLAASYHGNFYVNGEGLFEKEISHTSGYAAPRGKRKLAAWRDPQRRWFGLKFVVRNAESAHRVHLELWLDADANGEWKLLTQTDDQAGAWRSDAVDLDGCGAPPFHYASDQLLTWAGPWVTFRSDSVALDFRWLSVREIDAL